MRWALLAAGGAVVSAEDLLERVWEANTDPLTNTVRMTVMKLRRKLGDRRFSRPCPAPATGCDRSASPPRRSRAVPARLACHPP